MPTTIVADVRFRAELDATKMRGRASSVTGEVEADGSVVDVRFSRSPSLLASPAIGTGRSRGPFRSALRRSAGSWAERLEHNGLTVRVSGPHGLLVVAGEGAEAPWWQVPVTGTRRIRLGAPRAVFDSLGGPPLLDIVLPAPAAPSSRAMTRDLPRRALGVLERVPPVRWLARRRFGRTQT